jgi:hypothetical protein
MKIMPTIKKIALRTPFLWWFLSKQLFYGIYSITFYANPLNNILRTILNIFARSSKKNSNFIFFSVDDSNTIILLFIMYLAKKKPNMYNTVNIED